MHAFSMIWDLGSNERRDSWVDCCVLILWGLVWVGLGWVRLGFAELVAKFFRIRLILEPFDGGKSCFIRGLVAKDCGLMAEGNEGGFEDAVGDRGGCLHTFKLSRRQRGRKSFVRFFCVEGEGPSLSGGMRGG